MKVGLTPKPSRILITGTFCSGKTTLVDDVCHADNTMLAVPDECRPLLAVIPEVDWQLPDIRSYLWVRQALVELEANATGRTQVIDGGFITNLAHDRALLKEPPPREALLSHLGVPRYDFVFVCDPYEVDLVGDGQRYVDPVLRETIHSLVESGAREWGYELRRLHGTPAERVAQVLEGVS